MDSGNSGSLQSSRGGDEEYDSGAAHSFFMNTHSPPHLRLISTAPRPPPLFNPLSNYIQLRSDPNHRPASHAIISQTPAAARRPRKRPRASRRAPTTVLTTDTTNFRAMVQEFTAPPFNASSFSRFTPPPPYLRDSSAASSVATIPINYQLPITQNSNLFNVQNPNGLLQSNTRFRFPCSDAVASKPHNRDPFGIPITATEFDDFGLSLHENHASATLHELPNLVSPHQIGAKKDPNAVAGGYSFANGGRGPENMATRGEGMLESWI